MSTVGEYELTFAQVPSAKRTPDEGAAPRAEVARRRARRVAAPESVPTISRRSTLKMVVGLGAVVGFSAMRMLHFTQLAGADPADSTEGYQIWKNTSDGPCHPTLGYARNHNCDPICGPSLPSANHCTTATPFGGSWHRNGTFPDGRFWLRANNCGDNDEPNDNAKDGWLWNCGTTPYRCHDGWKDIGNGPVKTICRTNDLT
jgi:hypothetical protein